MTGLAVLILGVSGSGKTTVGTMLAEKIKAKFFDADDFHSPEARAKMHRGEPLNDTDRVQWLDNMYQSIKQSIDHGERVVFAVSGLKLKYRLVLRGKLDAKYVDQQDWIQHVRSTTQPDNSSNNQSNNQLNDQSIQMFLLHGPFDVLLDRINQRKNHFFPPKLLQSQLDALELPIDQSLNGSNHEKIKQSRKPVEESKNQSNNQSIRYIEDPVMIVDVRLGKDEIVKFIASEISHSTTPEKEAKNEKLVEETVQQTIEQSNSSAVDADHVEGLVEIYHPHSNGNGTKKSSL